MCILRKVNPWATEAEMLGALVADARRLGFEAYPETAGHDLILVAPAGREASGLQAGDTIAVEGKLRANLAVLRQALPPFRRGWLHGTRGAAFYAVAVPGVDDDFRQVAGGLGIEIIIVRPDGEVSAGRRWARRERLPETHFEGIRWDDGLRTGLAPLELPAIRVEMEAGCPSPRVVTPWKLDAVKLCLTAAARGGEVATADFKALHHLRHRTFVDRGWMRLVRRDGRAAVWALVDAPDRPDRAYPEIVAALAQVEVA